MNILYDEGGVLTMKRDMNDRVLSARIKDTHDVYNTSYLMVRYECDDFEIPYRAFVYDEERISPERVIGMTAGQLSSYSASFNFGYR